MLYSYFNFEFYLGDISMTMKIYEVRRKLIDGVNGYDLPRGAYVKTEDYLWVARFGADLKKAGATPNGTEPDIIEDTIEGSSEKIAKPKAEKQPEAPAEKAPQVERVKVQKRGGNKAVLNDESKTK